MKTFIHGVPYSKNKNRGDLNAPKVWTERVVAECAKIPKLSAACEVEVEFLLPQDKFPRDFPHGRDLDNLLKRFLDAVQKSGALENDSLIVKLTASKRKVRDGEQVGALVEFRMLEGAS
jgi:Holliday junction resolvase RusA-like endonuclease